MYSQKRNPWESLLPNFFILESDRLRTSSVSVVPLNTQNAIFKNKALNTKT